RVDVEPGGEPRQRLAVRPRLAALDLADVLLRAPARGELALGQAGGDPQRTHPLAEFTLPVRPLWTCPSNRFAHRRFCGQASLAQSTSLDYLTMSDMAFIVVTLQQRPPQERPGRLSGRSDQKRAPGAAAGALGLFGRRRSACGSHDDFRRTGRRRAREKGGRTARWASQVGEALLRRRPARPAWCSP